ncbi:MAG: hypothetical protein XD63_1469 [Thermoanaerobacterales bacterium 50_218]|nr:MAG: hypothetical protein XD63_1469 [Thermoanaerobacterales bacterium 50_218]
MNDRIPPIVSEYYRPLTDIPEGVIGDVMAQKWNTMEDLVLSFVLYLVSY